MRSLTRILVMLASFATSTVILGQSSLAVKLNAEANRAYYQGRAEEALGKFEAARKAASDARDRQYETIAMYGLARANIKLCNPREADRWFKASIEARDALPDDEYAQVTQNLVEYSRFLLVLGRPAEAIPLMERAIPKLDSIDLGASDPIAFAEFFDDYAGALEGSGLSSEAARSRASKLREANVGKIAKFKPEPYPVQCKTLP